jgi:hypothetical protein
VDSSQSLGSMADLAKAVVEIPAALLDRLTSLLSP